MDGDSLAARQHLEELERQRALEPRPPEPLWHTSVWILSWLTFTTSTVLMESNWIFLVYAVTIAISVALLAAQRRREGGRRPRVRTSMTTRETQATVLGGLVLIGLFAVSVTYETPWPLVTLNVAACLWMFVQALQAHRAQRPEAA